MTEKNKKATRLIGHILAWLLALCVPILLGEQIQSWHFLSRHAYNVALVAAVFYINYLWLIPTLYLKNKHLFFGISVVVVLIFTSVASSQISMRPRHPNPNMPHETKRIEQPIPKSRAYLMRSFFITLAGTAAAMGLAMGQNYQREKEARKTLENEQLKSELAMLKYQLQPHFFFNSLNTIYASIDKHPDIAKNAILKLSKLMRHLLYRANETQVSLAEEIEFIQAFIELMTERVSENLSVKTNFPTENTELIYVEPLLFIALIENAFKHGIAPNQKSEINIEILVETDQIICNVSNTFFPKNTEDQSGSGVGLRNLAKRLEKLYPQKNYTNTNVVKNGFYTAQLKLPRR